MNCTTSIQQLNAMSVTVGGISDKISIGTGFVGEIVNPLVWLQALPREDLDEILAKCLKLSIGAKDIEWKKHGSIQISSVDVLKPCEDMKFDFIVLPNKMSSDINRSQCERYGMMSIELIESQNHFEYLRKYIGEHQNKCLANEDVGWLLSNNHEQDNCLELVEASTDRLSCSTTRLCGLCQFPSLRPTFFLRGLCSLEEEDLSFVSGRYNDSTIYFQGPSGYVILSKDGMWQLKHSVNGAVIAELQNPHLLGTRIWEMRQPFCDKYLGSQITVSFTACDSSQSWCKSGMCISASERCNRFIDCDDKSDEENCDLFPTARAERMVMIDAFPKKSIEVTFEIEVLRVLQWKMDLPLQVILKSRLIWYDSESYFKNLEIGRATRIEQTPELWRPTLVPPGKAPDPDKCIGEECDDPVIITAYSSQGPLPDDRNNPSGGKLDMM